MRTFIKRAALVSRWFAAAISSAVISGLAASTPAHAAGDVADWAKVGPWRIKVDDTVGSGCFAMAAYQLGTVVRIGWNNSDGRFYMIWGDNRWANGIKVNGNYRLSIEFDNGAAGYDVGMTGIDMGGSHYLQHNNLGADFVADFANRQTMVIRDRTQRVLATLTLRGTQAAIDAVVQCQREVNNGAPTGGGSTRGQTFYSE